MARYRTLEIVDEIAQAITSIDGLEPIIVDGVLTGIIAGTLRVYAIKDKLHVSAQEPEQ